MEISDLFGLPAHPLIVHGVVVLVPLAAIGVMLSAVWPKARDKVGWVSLGFATVVLVLVPLAAGSGEELEERVDETRLVEEHAEMGENLLPWVIVLFVAALAVMALVLYRRYRASHGAAPAESAPEAVGAQPTWLKAVSVLVVVVAFVGGIGAIYETVEIGHSGAKATWDDVGPEGSEG